MKTPVVLEQPLPQEPVSHDTFLDDFKKETKPPKINKDVGGTALNGEINFSANRPKQLVH